MDAIRSGSVLPLNVVMIPMNDEVESDQFDIGTTSIKLIRVGNVIQMLSSNKFDAKILYREIVEKYKQDELSI